MELSSEFIIYLLGLAASWGAVMARIRALEKKMDKHNSLVERLARAEERGKSNSRRLDELEEQRRHQP